MKKTIIPMITFLVVIIIIVLVIIRKKTPDFKPIVSVTPVYLEKNDNTLYIKKKNWGLTGDYQVIVLSTNLNKDFSPNKKTEYVFEGLSPFFYKVDNGILTLYVRKVSEIPEIFNLKDFVKQEELTNQEMMTLFDNYKDKGIKKL
jgi:hypothetical protein